MASLTIDSVGKTFGTTRAISNVSIDVGDGEFVVLVGPSGCGKSTLLRMVAGLESLTEGRILLSDRDVSKVDPRDRDVAMVFQNYALYPHMTVFQNMAFSLEQRGMKKAEIEQKVLAAARTLDLDALVNRKPGALSGGQRQRVAMGRAIVRSPAIYLMDEPLSNLDAKLRVQMRAELKLLRARLGVTTLYVTHDQIEAMTLGDRVAVLAPFSEGIASNLQQVDSPQVLYLEPGNMFVAGFIGSPAMNFLYADIEGSGDGLAARLAGTETVIPLSRENTPVFAALSRYAGRRVVVGIRPEYFALQDYGEARSRRINVDILVSELVGPDAFLHFDLPTPEVDIGAMAALDDSGETGPQASRFSARVASEHLPRQTGSVDLFVEIPRLHYFDSDTSLRIC